jgi:hypothetical protein
LYDLTGTAYAKEDNVRLLTSGEQSIWLLISSHMKSPHRLNVALMRAKDGLAVFGNFRSIFKAVRLLDKSKNSSGKALSDFITDAVAHQLEVVDGLYREAQFEGLSAGGTIQLWRCRGTLQSPAQAIC